MKKHEVRGYIERAGTIAANRVYSADDALFAAAAVASSGGSVFERTLTVPQATKVIAHLIKTMPGVVVVGSGGVTNATVALDCIEA